MEKVVLIVIFYFFPIYINVIIFYTHTQKIKNHQKNQKTKKPYIKIIEKR